MATTVFASSNDSRMNSGGEAAWADARGDVSSASPFFSTTAANYQFGVYNILGGGRGGPAYSVVRSYFEFDLSSLSGTATSVDFKVFSDNLGSTSTNGGTAYLVEATALAGNGNDRGNIFSSGTTLGNNFGAFTISTTAGYHTLTLNSTGLSKVNAAIGSGTIAVGLIGYYDFTNTAPGNTASGNYNKFHVYYSEGTGTTKDPKLEIEGLTAAGYGHDVIGVTSTNISTVIGIATADIDNVIDVS
jgi:hypothetical protein